MRNQWCEAMPSLPVYTMKHKEANGCASPAANYIKRLIERSFSDTSTQAKVIGGDIIASMLEQDQITVFAYTLWSIWKERCSWVFGGKPVSVLRVLQAVRKFMEDATQAEALKIPRILRPVTRSAVNTDISCWIDGSLCAPNEGGIGYIIFKGQELLEYGMRHSYAHCALQMEALALGVGMEAVQARGLTECNFFTDCKQLCDAV